MENLDFAIIICAILSGISLFCWLISFGIHCIITKGSYEKGFGSLRSRSYITSLILCGVLLATLLTELVLAIIGEVLTTF